MTYSVTVWSYWVTHDGILTPRVMLDHQDIGWTDITCQSAALLIPEPNVVRVESTTSVTEEQLAALQADAELIVESADPEVI